MSKFSNKIAETLLVNDTIYAIGVEWSSFQDASESRKERNSKLENKKPDGNYDLRTVFTTANSLYHIVGFSSTDYILKGTKPLALMMLANIVQSIQDDNWIGIYKIGKGKYYVLFIQETTIHPDSDAVMSYEDAIAYKNEMEEMFSIKEQNIVIHTDKVDHAIDSIKNIITGDPATSKKVQGLKPYVFSIGEIHPAIYGVVAVAVIGGAWYSYSSYQANKIEEERIAQERREKLRSFKDNKMKSLEEKRESLILKIEDKRELIKKRYEEIYQGALTKKPEPWNMAMMPSDFFEACLPVMNGAPAIKSSWRLMSISCDANTVTSSYKIDGDVDVGKFFKLHPESTINHSGDVAMFTQKLQKFGEKANTGIPENKKEYEEAKYNFIGLFQYNKDITLTNGSSSSNSHQYYNPHAQEVEDYYNQQRSLRGKKEKSEEKALKDMETSELEDVYNDMLSDNEIQNLSVNDLPIEYKLKLNDFYKKDWLIENSTIKSLTPISQMGESLDDIKGLRVENIGATVSEEKAVTWNVGTSLYVRDKAIN